MSPDRKPRASRSKSLGFALADPGNSPALLAMLMEYEVLRREIDVYHEQMEKITAYNLLALGALFPALEWLNRNREFSFVLMLYPLLFCLFGYLYADKMVRVLRIADYLHNGLRPKVIRHCEEAVLQWEIYKKHFSPFPTATALYLDLTRWALFVLPGAISMALYFIFYEGSFYRISDVLLLILDAILLLLLALAIHNINETTGITSRQDIDLDQYEPQHIKTTLED